MVALYRLDMWYKECLYLYNYAVQLKEKHSVNAIHCIHILDVNQGSYVTAPFDQLHIAGIV